MALTYLANDGEHAVEVLPPLMRGHSDEATIGVVTIGREQENCAVDLHDLSRALQVLGRDVSLTIEVWPKDGAPSFVPVAVIEELLPGGGIVLRVAPII